ncbi:MAG: hypothetical protein ACOVNY_10395 [Chitinophagaceae bacterium]
MRLTSVLLVAFSAILFSCSPVKIAIINPNWQQQEELSVKGRQGFMLNQKLSFGAYTTNKVNRSWTKGSSWTWSVPLQNDWVESLNETFVQKKQTIRFSLKDAVGNESEVTAFTKVKWTDISIGKNPNSLVNIIADILTIGDNGSNTFAVRIMPAKNQAPWEMFIDNDAAQQKAKTYTGILAKSKTEYYTVVPIYSLKNKQGNAVSMPFGGSVGYEFRDKNGVTLAAVSLIDKGMVYFNNVPPAEKFLLANAITALLLQQQID